MPATTHVTHVTVSMADRPKTGVRPKTTRGRRTRGSVESLNSSQDESQIVKNSSSQDDEAQTFRNNDEREKRLLNRSRAQTAPTSKYHSSCSLSSSSSDSLGSSGTGSLVRAKSMDDYPSPDTIHLTCRVSNDKPGYYEFLRPYSAYTTPLWKPPKLPEGFRDSKKLNHSALTEGEKFYLWRTARVYGMTNMKKQNQNRYEKLLRHTVETGFHTEQEVQKYMNYFNGTRKRQFHTDPTVWRSPPRIPVRPLHFRKPPTSPRGWNSYSPQGGLGKGRADKANSSFSENKNGKTVSEKKNGKQKRGQQKKNKGLLEEILGDADKTRQADEDDEGTRQKKDQDGDQQKEDGTASPADSANDKETETEEQSGPKIYYDMKLRRTVIKPGSKDANKADQRATSKTGASKNNKVSWEDQRSKTAGPQRPPPTRISWEDPGESVGEESGARPKTSRGRMQRVQSARQRGNPKEVDASNERKSPDSSGRQSTTSSGSSSSGSGRSYTGSSSGSSGDSSRSSSTLKGYNDNVKDSPSKSNAVVNNKWEDEDDDEARAALAQSFWNQKVEDQDGEGQSSNKHEAEGKDSPKRSKSRTSSRGSSNKVEYLYSSFTSSDGSTSRSSDDKSQHEGQSSNNQESASTSNIGSPKSSVSSSSGNSSSSYRSNSSLSRISVKGQPDGHVQFDERSSKQKVPEHSASSPRSTKSSKSASSSGTSSSGSSSSSVSNSSVKGQQKRSNKQEVPIFNVTSPSTISSKSSSSRTSSSGTSSSSSGRSSSSLSNSSVKGQQERSNKQELAPLPSTSSPRSTKSSMSGTTSRSSSRTSGSSSTSSSTGSSSTSGGSSYRSSSVKGYQEGQSSQTSQSLVSDDESDDSRAKLAQSFWGKK